MCVGISPAGRSCQITDALESFLELASALQSIRPCGTDEEINIAEQAVLMRTLSLHKKHDNGFQKAIYSKDLSII